MSLEILFHVSIRSLENSINQNTNITLLRSNQTVKSNHLVWHLNFIRKIFKFTQKKKNTLTNIKAQTKVTADVYNLLGFFIVWVRYHCTYHISSLGQQFSVSAMPIYKWEDKCWDRIQVAHLGSSAVNLVCEPPLSSLPFTKPFLYLQSPQISVAHAILRANVWRDI